MTRAHFLRFIPLLTARWAISVLQELRDLVAATTELVAEIGFRFKQGDPADEQVAQLELRLATLGRQASGAELPRDLQTEIASLLARVRETVATGDEWLARAGPELASQHARQRLRRAYGVT